MYETLQSSICSNLLYSVPLNVSLSAPSPLPLPAGLEVLHVDTNCTATSQNVDLDKTMQHFGKQHQKLLHTTYHPPCVPQRFGFSLPLTFFEMASLPVISIMIFLILGGFMKVANSICKPFVHFHHLVGNSFVFQLSIQKV